MKYKTNLNLEININSKLTAWQDPSSMNSYTSVRNSI
jgi:hypothetical protein